MAVSRCPKCEADAHLAWIPEAGNASKLRAHRFDRGQWFPLPRVKCVPWPEAFPEVKDKP